MKVDTVRRKARFAAWLKDRFFLRFHMAVILGLAFVAGLAVTKLFLMSGNANLAPALIPAARRAEAEGWVPGVIRATALPFVCMFIAAVAFGWAANDLCPEARRMVDVVACAGG